MIEMATETLQKTLINHKLRFVLLSRSCGEAIYINRALDVQLTSIIGTAINILETSLFLLGDARLSPWH